MNAKKIITDVFIPNINDDESWRKCLAKLLLSDHFLVYKIALNMTLVVLSTKKFRN